MMSLQRLVMALVLIAVFTMAVRIPISADMWWHLRCGEVQWRTRSVLKSDIFSHTAAGVPWINQSWLPQLAMYGLFAAGGFPALALAVAAVVTAAMMVVLASSPCAGRYGHFWRAAVVLWAAIAGGRVWAARPHVLSLLLVAVWLYLLDRRRGQVLWLPVVMLLWVNAHGSYIIGFILLVLELGGVLLDAVWEKKFDGLGERTRPLLLATLLCVGAVVCNPQGIRLPLSAFQILSSSAQQSYISEWASPDFHQLDMLPFLAMLLATWGVLAFGKHKASGVELLRLLGFSALALRAGRYIGLCTLVLAPLLVRYGALLFSEVGKNWGRRSALVRPLRGAPLLNWLLLLLILIAAGIKIGLPLNKQTIAQAQGRLFPIEAVRVMQERSLPSTLFNEYGWGGYLIWELYPDTPVFIDGRADPYSDALIGAYRSALLAQPGWQGVLDEYEVNTALLNANSALAAMMQESRRWERVYQDDIAAIFVRQEIQP